MPDVGYLAEWLLCLPDPTVSRRRVDDEVLTTMIVEAHAASRHSYGAPRIHAELTAAAGCSTKSRGSHPKPRRTVHPAVRRPLSGREP